MWLSSYPCAFTELRKEEYLDVKVGFKVATLMSASFWISLLSSWSSLKDISLLRRRTLWVVHYSYIFVGIISLFSGVSRPDLNVSSLADSSSITNKLFSERKSSGVYGKNCSGLVSWLFFFPGDSSFLLGEKLFFELVFYIF